MSTTVNESWGRPLGFQRITSLSSAQSLTVPAGSEIAVIGCTTQNVRWRDDGSAPTASAGMLIRTTDQPFVYRGELARIQFIETTASASLEVSYYGTEPAAT